MLVAAPPSHCRSMTAFVFTAVLAAAALHAGWNTVVKVGADRFIAVTLVAISGGVVALALLPFTDMPRAAAWPWLIASALLHIGYNLFLARAYRTGDLGQVYPIARGAAPLLVTIVMLAGLGEVLQPIARCGIAVLAGGVGLMSFRGGRDLERLEPASVGFALATSVFIAGYTVTDGIGARAGGSAHSYAVWLFLLDGLCMLGVLLLVRGTAGLRDLRPVWRAGLASGSMSLVAYWIVIWAMTVAPIALVAALRESSVLFAAAISTSILREPFSRWRAAAATLIVLGVVLVRIG